MPFFGSGQAVSNDIFILQKNGANVKTYETGMNFIMETIYQQWFEGTITAIRHDSIFVNGIPFHYKEIQTVRTERTKLNYKSDGLILMLAGAGVLALGAINGAYRGDKTKNWYKPTSFITAGALLVVGFILLRSQFKKYPLGKKFTLQYLELNPNKK